MCTQRWIMFASVCGLVGCAAENELGLTEWQGPDSHLLIQGALAGVELDIDIVADQAGNPDRFWCKREYEVPMIAGVPRYENGSLVEFAINGLLEVNGAARLLELEFKRHDFQSDAADTEVLIVPRTESRYPERDQMWLEWEWHTPDASQRLYTEAARTGVFRLGAFTGKIGADGLVIETNSGMVGGFFAATWSATEQVTGSFSIPCMVSRVEFIEE